MGKGRGVEGGKGGVFGRLFEMTLTLIHQSILSFHVAKFCSGQSCALSTSQALQQQPRPCRSRWGLGAEQQSGGGGGQRRWWYVVVEAPNCPSFLSKLRDGENVKSLNFSPLSPVESAALLLLCLCAGYTFLLAEAT